MVVRARILWNLLAIPMNTLSILLTQAPHSWTSSTAIRCSCCPWIAMEEMGRLDRSVSWSKWYGIIVNPKRARADKHERKGGTDPFAGASNTFWIMFHQNVSGFSCPPNKRKTATSTPPPQKKKTYIHFLRLFHPQILPLSLDPRLKWVKIRRCFQVALCVVSAEPFYLGYLFSESLGFLRRCR